jgi:chemotaxis protein CheD
MLPARRMSSEARNPAEERRVASHDSPDTRYADIAIDEMLKKIEAEGAKKEFIVAKLTGAANMFSASIGKIGEDNLSYAREKLKHVGVPIAGECIGGTQGRSVEFSIATGIITVKTKF